MTTTHSRHIPVGTKVLLSPNLSRRWASRVMLVVSQPSGPRGVNYLVSDATGRELVRVSYEAVTVYDGDVEAGFVDHARTQEAYRAGHLHVGTPARYTGDSSHLSPLVGVLLVSLGPGSGAGTTRIAILGGEQDTYWRAVPTEDLQAVKVQAVDDEPAVAI